MDLVWHENVDGGHYNRFWYLQADGEGGPDAAYVFPPHGFEKRWQVNIEHPVSATLMLDGTLDMAQLLAVAIVRAAVAGHV